MGYLKPIHTFSHNWKASVETMLRPFTTIAQLGTSLTASPAKGLSHTFPCLGDFDTGIPVPSNRQRPQSLRSVLEKAAALTPWEQGSANPIRWLTIAPYSVSSIGRDSLAVETNFRAETGISLEKGDMKRDMKT